jgi:hypothetical protein
MLACHSPYPPGKAPTLCQGNRQFFFSELYKEREAQDKCKTAEGIKRCGWETTWLYSCLQFCPSFDLGFLISKAPPGFKKVNSAPLLHLSFLMHPVATTQVCRLTFCECSEVEPRTGASVEYV